MEDNDECRICRSGAEAGRPLYWPCACSGSIRHVHEDCLADWLERSNKKSCELCGKMFRFTPVYREDAPERLSIFEFVAAGGLLVLRNVGMLIRKLVICGIWLGGTPLLTQFCWNYMTFYCGFSLPSDKPTDESIIGLWYHGILLWVFVLGLLVIGFFLKEHVTVQMQTEALEEDTNEEMVQQQQRHQAANNWFRRRGEVGVEDEGRNVVNAGEFNGENRAGQGAERNTNNNNNNNNNAHDVFRFNSASASSSSSAATAAASSSNIDYEGGGGNRNGNWGGSSSNNNNNSDNNVGSSSSHSYNYSQNINNRSHDNGAAASSSSSGNQEAPPPPPRVVPPVVVPIAMDIHDDSDSDDEIDADDGIGLFMRMEEDAAAGDNDDGAIELIPGRNTTLFQIIQRSLSFVVCNLLILTTILIMPFVIGRCAMTIARSSGLTEHPSLYWGRTILQLIGYFFLILSLFMWIVVMVISGKWHPQSPALMSLIFPARVFLSFTKVILVIGTQIVIIPTAAGCLLHIASLPLLNEPETFDLDLYLNNLMGIEVFSYCHFGLVIIITCNRIFSVLRQHVVPDALGILGERLNPDNQNLGHMLITPVTGHLRRILVSLLLIAPMAVACATVPLIALHQVVSWPFPLSFPFSSVETEPFSFFIFSSMLGMFKALSDAVKVFMKWWICTAATRLGVSQILKSDIAELRPAASLDQPAPSKVLFRVRCGILLTLSFLLFSSAYISLFLLVSLINILLSFMLHNASVRTVISLILTLSLLNGIARQTDVSSWHSRLPPLLDIVFNSFRIVCYPIIFGFVFVVSTPVLSDYDTSFIIHPFPETIAVLTWICGAMLVMSWEFTRREIRDHLPGMVFPQQMIHGGADLKQIDWDASVLVFFMSFTYLISKLVLPLFGVSECNAVLMWRLSFPVFTWGLSLYVALLVIKPRLKTIHDSIRDSRYLIGKQLNNAEPSSSLEQTAIATTLAAASS